MADVTTTRTDSREPGDPRTGPTPSAAPSDEPSDELSGGAVVTSHLAATTRLRRRILRDPIAIAACAVLVIVAAAAVLAPWLAPHDPTEIDNSVRLTGPGTDGHILGTDEVGRDILSRLMWGGRVSLLVAIVPTLIAGVIGTTIGLAAGYFRGAVDYGASRLVDIMLAFPYLLMAMAIATALGPGAVNAALAITVISIPIFARLVRSSALKLRNTVYVEAALTMGATHRAVIWRHVLPNALGPIIVYATLQTGFMIVASSSLSFLGLGVQPPTADWGAMLAAGRQYLRTDPHVVIMPGLTIFVVSLSLNLLGEALRDVLDPNDVALES